MPNPRTIVTELGTGIGMLGCDDIEQALATRTPVMRTLSPEDWGTLVSLRSGGAYDVEFHAAWENGRAFLSARDGLRGRPPEVVEWKGSQRAPGDEVAPIDLRVDHVYLVSCKYLSNILFNVSPTHVFDDLLVGGQGRRGRTAGGDWYADVAPSQYQDLYELVRSSISSGTGGVTATSTATPVGKPRARHSGAQSLPGLGTDAGVTGGVVGKMVGGTPDGGPDALLSGHSAAALDELPARAVDLTSNHRAALGQCLKGGWPGEAKAAYEALSAAVAQASVARWRASLTTGGGATEAMLWRLLRMGSTPYFVLGSSATQSLRLRIATPWDWRQIYSLSSLDLFAQAGGQPRVGWTASVRQRSSGQVIDVSGHVEVRWSHGRFGGPPEAKGYLDTPHHLVPGYFPLK